MKKTGDLITPSWLWAQAAKRKVEPSLPEKIISKVKSFIYKWK